MVEGPRGVTVLASLSPRAHVEGFEGRVMGWGLGGVSRQAGSCCSSARPPHQAWRPLPLGGPGCGQPSQGLGWARPGQQSLLGPGCAATLARGEDAFPLPSGAASPFPPTISGSGSVNLTVAMATPASRQLLAASGRRALPCQGLGGAGKEGAGILGGQPGVRGRERVGCLTSGIGTQAAHVGVRLGSGL